MGYNLANNSDIKELYVKCNDTGIEANIRNFIKQATTPSTDSDNQIDIMKIGLVYWLKYYANKTIKEELENYKNQGEDYDEISVNRYHMVDKYIVATNIPLLKYIYVTDQIDKINPENIWISCNYSKYPSDNKFLSKLNVMFDFDSDLSYHVTIHSNIPLLPVDVDTTIFKHFNQEIIKNNDVIESKYTNR